MAYVKITELDPIDAHNVEDDDVLMIDDVSMPESFKLTIADLRAKLIQEVEEEIYFLALYAS